MSLYNRLKNLLQPKLAKPLPKPVVLSIEERIRRGTNAEMLSRNETLKEAIEHIERTYMQRWRNTAVEETERRELAWLAVNTLDDISKCLHTWLAEAKHESDKLKAEREAKTRNGRHYA